MIEFITKVEAKTRGFKQFFEGKPCPHGHISARNVSDGKCKTCVSERKKRWIAANEDRNREYNRNRYLKNADLIKKRSAAWFKNNKARAAETKRKKYQNDHNSILERKRKWREKNKEKVNENWRLWRAKNKDKNNESGRLWRIKNPDRTRDIRIKYKRNNPEAARINFHKRRARELAVGGSYTSDDIKRIYKMQNACCAYCRHELKGKFQVDHIVAISKGGPNIARNIQLLCNKYTGGCNQRKGAKDPVDFARELGFLI